MSKWIGHNPVAVLATLLLMSYTKLLKVVIEVVSSVRVDYPGGHKEEVWLKDANEPYLELRHLALTVVTSLWCCCCSSSLTHSSCCWDTSSMAVQGGSICTG